MLNYLVKSLAKDTSIMKLYEEFRLYENLWEGNKQQNTEVLNEANSEQQLRGFLRFRKGMSCPGGCGKILNTEADYKKHINNCTEIHNILYCRPAVALAKEEGWDADLLKNISALAYLAYINKHMECEICGKELSIEDRKPDHKHSKETERKHRTGEGSFRGVLCDNCNRLLGKFEKIGRDTVSKYFNYLEEADTKIEIFNKRPISELVYELTSTDANDVSTI